MRIRRRRKAFLAVVLVVLAVRLVTELANRIVVGHRGQPISLVMTAVNDAGSASNNDPEQLDVNLTTSVDVRVDYPAYVPVLPRFVSVDDRRTFISDDNNRVYLAVPPSTHLTGRIRTVWNGVIRPGHECSWRTSDEEFSSRAHSERSTTYVNKTLCPLLVPDGQTFQHFVDGVLPKLGQLLTEAPQTAAAVDLFVVYRPRDAIIYDLLKCVGITSEQLLLVSTGSRQVLEARRVVDTCVTPSVHPRLARRASQLLRACQQTNTTSRAPCCNDSESQRTYHPDDQHRGLGGGTRYTPHHVCLTNSSALIVLLTRRWSRNGGRRLLNENAILEYLVGRFGRPRVALFGNRRVDLSTAAQLFSRAVAVVGVHGGAFYNIVLAPRGCVVVELMPLVVRHGTPVLLPPRRLAHTIVWRMADALGHTYWRLYDLTSSPRSDVTLSIDKLRSSLTGIT